MSGNVFEQYQKYFESLITQHKAACQLENQSHHVEAQSLQQQVPQLQQQPQQQLPTPLLQQQPVLPSPQPLPQDSFAQDGYSQQLSPAASYNYWPRHVAPNYRMAAQPSQLSQPSMPMQPPVPVYRSANPDCGYYMCLNPYQQYQQQQLTQPYYPPQLLSYQPQYYPEFGARQEASTAAIMAPPELHGTAAANATFRPDGRAEAEAADAADAGNKKQTFCYPNSVKGFQGSIPCGPCTSCKAPAASTTGGQPGPQQGQPGQQQGQPGLPHGQSGLQQGPQGLQPGPPCDGGKNCSGWITSGVKERLPLGAEEPFIVGPTTYQYFFDNPA